MNYLVLYPTPDGRAGDIYVFVSGERMSATMRRLLGAGLGAGEAGERGIQTLEQMDAALLRGDADAALRAYETLPDSLKNTTAVQVKRVQAASLLDDRARLAAVVADVDRRLPDDPALDLLKVGVYGDDPAKLVATLRRLDAAVGGDPHLRGMLAEHLPDVGESEEALRVATAAAEAEPDLWQPVYGLLAAHIGLGDHAAAVGVLRRLRDEWDVAFDREDFTEWYTGGEAFVDSPEYAAFAAE